MLTAIISALVGVNLAQAIPETLKTILYFSLPFCVLSSLTAVKLELKEVESRIFQYLSCLVIGQSLAGLHSVISVALDMPDLRPHIPGPVTESGQLVLILPCLFVMFLRARRTGNTSAISVLGIKFHSLIYFGALAAAQLLLAWPNLFPYKIGPTFQTYLQCGALLSILLLATAWIQPKDSTPSHTITDKQSSFLGVVWSAALLLVVFLINLKRGPWLGVISGLFLLGGAISRRVLLLALLVAVFLITLLAPVRERMLHSGDDFSVYGGRKNMWMMGVELVERFPLGLGLDNARYMRELLPGLPPLHRHMHNNLLNIAVETGWVGLLTYCWWMLAIILFPLNLWKRARDLPKLKDLATVCLATSTAILGWQIAGLVEYNFGDGEIRMIVLMLIGIVLGIDYYLREESTRG